MRSAASLMAVAMVGCVADADLTDPEMNAQTGVTDEAITAAAPVLPSCNSDAATENAILAHAPANARPFFERVFPWVNERLPYANQPEDGSNGYRADCSGLVSRAWNLPPQGLTTYEFATGVWAKNLSHPLGGFGDLVIGDAVSFGGVPANKSGHIMLFAGWLDVTHTTFCVVEEHKTGTPAAIRQ